ncbi:MAG: hypothetical protein AAFO79_06815, partial [Pseudomonadota bacterium]
EYFHKLPPLLLSLPSAQTAPGFRHPLRARRSEQRNVVRLQLPVKRRQGQLCKVSLLSRPVAISKP